MNLPGFFAELWNARAPLTLGLLMTIIAVRCRIVVDCSRAC